MPYQSMVIELSGGTCILWMELRLYVFVLHSCSTLSMYEYSKRYACDLTNPGCITILHEHRALPDRAIQGIRVASNQRQKSTECVMAGLECAGYLFMKRVTKRRVKVS